MHGSKQHFIHTGSRACWTGRRFLPSDAAELAEQEDRGQATRSCRCYVVFRWWPTSSVRRPRGSVPVRELRHSRSRRPVRQGDGESPPEGEIIATAVTNSTLINRMGARDLPPACRTSGRSPGEVAKAFTITRAKP
jgi:glutamate dehydrogenase